MKVLICGDSFSYNHQIEHSWPTRLSKLYAVDNLSQCGCGEYKIRLQMTSCDLDKYDAVLIFHTSPNRIYYSQPNIMHTDKYHDNSDLLFADVEHHRRTHVLAQIAYDYFVNIFDIEYYSYIHNLICADINDMTKQIKTYHFSTFDYSNLYQFDNSLIDLYNVWMDNPGNVNHLNEIGHDKVFKIIKDLLSA